MSAILETETDVPSPHTALDVWLIPDCDDDMASHEANTFRNSDGSYRIEWYLNAVGLVKTETFDTLKEAYEWYEREGFEDFSS